MPGSLSTVEARGIGVNDVVLIERIFQRVMSAGPILSQGPGGRLRHSTIINSNNNNNSSGTATSYRRGPGRPSARVSTAPASGHAQLGGPVGLYVAPGVTPPVSENQAPVRFRHYRSAGINTKRQMATDCGLKSLPVNSKWTPAGRSNLLLDLAADHQGPVHQSQIYLQPPDGNVSSRRGLSGSKVRPVAVTPRSDSQTPRAGSLPGSEHHQDLSQHHHNLPSQQHHPLPSETVGYPVAPSPRPLSKRFSSRSSVAVLEEEDESGLVRCYKWNSSDQGIRLQRQLSTLSSSRNMKRASEMVSHRLDPMYLMSGSKLSLQNRYGIDEHEMQRLQEMTQIREGLLSDLKKMKFPYGARASSKHLVTSLKHPPQGGVTPRIAGAPSKAKKLSPGGSRPAHPSTPASDPAGAVTDREPPTQEVPSEHSDVESSHAATE